MTGLIESLREAHATLPPAPEALAIARAAAINALAESGLPGPRSESWKYTSLRALARHRFPLAPPSAAVDGALHDLVGDVPTPRCVFVNGKFNAELSSDAMPDGVTMVSMADALAAGDPVAIAAMASKAQEAGAVFALANSALANDGVQLQVATNAKVEPAIHLVLVSDGRSAERGSSSGIGWHARHLIRLAAGAELCLVQHERSLGDGKTLGTSNWQIELEPNAQLQHWRAQDLGAGSNYFQRNDVRLGSEALYRRLDLELGTGLARNELNVQLAAAGARLQANGVLLGSNAAHCDTRLGIVHAAGNTSCELTWRGLGRDRSRVAFHGGITIESGADGSEAMLSNKNLLLSAEAEIDTQPVLVIHADEVKAAHGATVGRLDPTALFYLRSRGLPAEQARRLLTAAFCRELLAQIAQDDLRQVLSDRLDAALAREAGA